MNIKDYKGSVSLEDFAKGITAQPGRETLGAVWGHTVDCNHCCFQSHCREISAQVLGIYCDQVIDFLLGDKSIEDISKELI